MPFYEYLCPKCGTKFDLMRAIADRDNPAPCPTCGAKKTHRELPHVMTNIPGGSSCGTCAPSGSS
jgi:putative FmdB family regulatory protein